MHVCMNTSDKNDWLSYVLTFFPQKNLKDIEKDLQKHEVNKEAVMAAIKEVESELNLATKENAAVELAIKDLEENNVCMLCMYVCKLMRACVCIYACLYVCIYVCNIIQNISYTCVYIYVCMYVGNSTERVREKLIIVAAERKRNPSYG
jgi:hypothetical protein